MFAFAPRPLIKPVVTLAAPVYMRPHAVVDQNFAGASDELDRKMVKPAAGKDDAFAASILADLSLLVWGHTCQGNLSSGVNLWVGQQPLGSAVTMGPVAAVVEGSTAPKMACANVAVETEIRAGAK